MSPHPLQKTLPGAGGEGADPHRLFTTAPDSSEPGTVTPAALHPWETGGPPHPLHLPGHRSQGWVGGGEPRPFVGTSGQILGCVVGVGEAVAEAHPGMLINAICFLSFYFAIMLLSITLGRSKLDQVK